MAPVFFGKCFFINLTSSPLELKKPLTFTKSPAVETNWPLSIVGFSKTTEPATIDTLYLFAKFENMD